MNSIDELPGVETLPDDTFLRLRVSVLRTRIEVVVADGYSKCSGRPARQNRVNEKIPVLLRHSKPQEWMSDYDTVRLARYCYSRSSDVMHGRATMLAINASIVAEWESIVDALVELYSRFVERDKQAKSM